LAFGPDLDTVPTSGNTSRQHARIPALLTEPRLPVPKCSKRVLVFLWEYLVIKDIPKE
jgi:hypothetical protein